MSAQSDFQGAAFSDARPSKPKPFAIRLTSEERRLLESRAGRMPLGAYIRECALGSHARKRRVSRAVHVDDKAVAKLLATLGRSHLSSNLNQIAKAANIGTLAMTPDLEAELQEACADIRAMRSLLVEALGLLESAAP